MLSELGTFCHDGCLFLKLYNVPQKHFPFYFLNNSVKNVPISTIFGAWNPEEICA